METLEVLVTEKRRWDIGTGSEIRSACPGQEAGSFDGDDNHHHTLADWMWTPITVMPSEATDCGKSALTCEVCHVTVALLTCLVLLCKRKTRHNNITPLNLQMLCRYYVTILI